MSYFNFYNNAYTGIVMKPYVMALKPNFGYRVFKPNV